MNLLKTGVLIAAATNLFASHPDTLSCIKRLRAMAGVVGPWG